MNPLELDFSEMANVVPVQTKVTPKPGTFTDSDAAVMLSLFEEDQSLRTDAEEIESLFAFVMEVHTITQNETLTNQQKFEALGETTRQTLGFNLVQPSLESFGDSEVAYESAIGDFLSKIGNWISNKVKALVKGISDATTKIKRLFQSQQGRLESALNKIKTAEIKTGDIPCSQAEGLFLSDGTTTLDPMAAMEAMINLAEITSPSKGGIFKEFQDMTLETRATFQEAVSGLVNLSQTYILSIFKATTKAKGEEANEKLYTSSPKGMPAGGHFALLTTNFSSSTPLEVLSSAKYLYTSKPGPKFKVPETIAALSKSDLTRFTTAASELCKSVVLGSDPMVASGTINNKLKWVDDWIQDTSDESNRDKKMVATLFSIMIYALSDLFYRSYMYLNAQFSGVLQLVESHI